MITNEQQGDPSGFEFWRSIASSGPKVTSESLTDTDFARIHVETPLEDFVIREVRQGTSLFLTGNAGDGKTHVLRRLAPVLRDCGAVVVEDATALMRTNNIGPVLDRWRTAIASKTPFCIAINEYPLHLLRAASRSPLPGLASELDRQCRSRLAYGPTSEVEERREQLLVIDLSLRNPLHPEFAQRMLSTILETIEWDTVSPKAAPMLAKNLSRLRDPQVQRRLLGLFGRLSDMGFRSTIRELWIVLARLALGYRPDLKPSLAEGMRYWYSEIIFSNDQRFRLCQNLSLTDPGKFSHPIWDVLIEDGENTTLVGWNFGLPRLNLSVRPDRATFQAFKRAFYFEHKNGEECFALEDPDAANFRELLHGHSDDDPIAKTEIIKAINLAYCPIEFPGSGDSVYLWNGHRFDEQPSRVFLANRHIPKSEFRLLRPRIPNRVKDAFTEYRPDHLVLRYNGNVNYLASLRIDFPLYLTLQKLRRGLPRKLLPEADVFRLDAFLEALHPVGGATERRILSSHLERRELLEIDISPNERRYESISMPRQL